VKRAWISGLDGLYISAMAPNKISDSYLALLWMLPDPFEAPFPPRALPSPCVPKVGSELASEFPRVFAAVLP